MIKQRKIAKYVLLQIVTLGIYGLFFWSDWTEDLNKMCEDDDKGGTGFKSLLVQKSCDLLLFFNPKPVMIALP